MRHQPGLQLAIQGSMADVFTPEVRSAVMSRIRSRDNCRTELRLVSLFRRNQITGWRRQIEVTGKPDFGFRRLKVAVFVDGCFWHRHKNCRWAYVPKTRQSYWRRKFRANVVRDKSVNLQLRKAGWKVIRIWECELATDPACSIATVQSALRLRMHQLACDT